MGMAAFKRAATRRLGAAVSNGLFLAVLLSCGGGGGGEVPVQPCSVQSLTLSPSSVSLTVGESTALTPNVSTANCSAPPPISWSSAAPNIASVDGSGE